jgi:hypothetical protein
MLAAASGPVLLQACRPEDACDRMCGAALPAYETCMRDWGSEWGDPGGYESREDFENWCATYNEERRQLARTAAEPRAEREALLLRCEEQGALLEEPDCGEYWDVFDK